jgi:subtilase family serine protease
MSAFKTGIPLAVAILLLTAATWSSSAQQANVDVQVQSPILVRAQGKQGVVGLTPAQIRKAYGFDQIANGGAGQVIAIVVAYDHPHVERDLERFSSTFGLPPCAPSNGCFQKIYASGKKPGAKNVWGLESALGVQWAHAIAPEARLMLVEAPSDLLSDMLHAVNVAVRNGASVVSMSWGAPEFAGELANDNRFVAPGVTFFAAAGNSGTGTLYPAASPNVVGIGGTTLTLDANGNYLGETAWAGSGGGQSLFETAPAYQYNLPIPNNPGLRRGIPDVAYNANPDSGFAVFNSFPIFGLSGWYEVGGTSATAPQWAGLAAIVNSARALRGKGPLAGSPGVFYDVPLPAAYNDIITGSNGTCGTLCMASAGYDYITGLGSPRADRLIPALVNRP